MVPQNLLLASSCGFLFGGDNMKEEKFFEEYTSKYDKTLFGIDLKYNHSYRVVKKAELISKSIKLNKKDMELVDILHQLIPYLLSIFVLLFTIYTILTKDNILYLYYYIS